MFLILVRSLPSEHFLASSLKILGIVEVLIKESLQAVANDLGPVVSEAFTQSIKFAHEVLGCSDSHNLISTDLVVHAKLLFCGFYI